MDRNASDAGGATTPTGTATSTNPVTAKIKGCEQSTDGHRRRRDRLVAVGEYFPPVGRRHLGAVIVRRCPSCRHLHQHHSVVVGTADGSIRTGSCGAVYILRVLPALASAS
jgi:hypothetical protein